MEACFSGDFGRDAKRMEELLRIRESFDVIGRAVTVGGQRARLYFVDGFVKDSVMEKVMEVFLSLDSLSDAPDAKAFCERHVPYMEADTAGTFDAVITGVLSGTPALLIEGYREAVLIDARTYPARGVEEPGDDKVLRGSHDGFVETLVSNTALIRRRIRDARLTMEYLSAGEKSRTDIVLCYMSGTADEHLIARIRKKISSVSAEALTMNQESLAESLTRPQWYNPFPKVRYTERPDAAAASVLEGSVLVLVDNSPSVMVLPTSVFDFVQDANDFYFPPLVGTYLRLVRMLIFLLTLLLTPTWYLLITHPDLLPPSLSFLQVQEPNGVPILAQLLIVEFVIDGLKLASLNTPSVLSNSFSVVGALILGDFAVQARWFVPEVVLYMAFVAIANFTQPSFELGYAFKLFRMVILVLTALFGVWGYAGGLLLMLAIAMSTRTISGRPYLYPLLPLHPRALLRLLIRMPISKENS